MANEAQSLNANDMVEKFINQLVIDAGMDKDLGESTLVGLKKDLQERLENRMKAMIFSQISKDKIGDFEKVIDSGDNKAMQDFCTNNIVNFPELIAAELLNFRSRYIA